MFNWIKIYSGFNTEEFYQIKNLLENEGIQIKTKVSSPTRDRMNKNIILGGNPLILNTVGMNSSVLEEYTILVKKEQEGYAKNLIQKFRY